MDARGASIDTSARRPDVAILVHDLKGSGVVRNAIRIARAARAGGINAELWAIRASGEMAADALDVPVRAIAADVPAVERRLDETYAARAALTALLDAQRPRLLLSAGNHVHWLASRARAGARHRRDIRLVLRMSNPIGPKLPGGLAGLLARTWLTHRNLGRADLLVAVSEELSGALRATPGFAGKPIRLIRNGIDLDAVQRAAAAPLDDPWFAPGAPPLIVGVGRLHRQKGFDVLIEAFAIARAERPLRLVILGGGTASERAALQAQAERLGVAADMRLAGFEPNPHRYVARAAQLVISSRWEGASNVLLEALACGTPVVATRCPTGIAEIVAPDALAPLVPVDHAPALAAAMLARLAQPRDADRLRRRAAEFDLAASRDAYVRLLRAEVEPQPASTPNRIDRVAVNGAPRMTSTMPCLSRNSPA